MSQDMELYQRTDHIGYIQLKSEADLRSSNHEVENRKDLEMGIYQYRRADHN